MIVEMRTYQTRPGTRDRFLRAFEELSLPEHYRLGMKIAGPFLAVDDPDTFFFMRGFSDAGAREKLNQAFYEGRLWKEQLEMVLMPMLVRYDVVLVDDPAESLTWNEPATGGFKGDDL
jgi:hypothetical protein